MKIGFALVVLLAFPVSIMAQMSVPLNNEIVESPLPEKTILQGKSNLSYQVGPGYDFAFPIKSISDYYGPGGRIAVGLEYRLPKAPALFLTGRAAYLYETAKLIPFSMSGAALSAGVGLRFDIASWLALKLSAAGGGLTLVANGNSDIGSNSFYVEFRTALDLLSGPLRMEAGASANGSDRLGGWIAPYLGLSYELPSNAAASWLRPAAARPRSTAQAATGSSSLSALPLTEDSGLQLSEFSFEPIYPVFRSYYDDHALGKALLRNQLTRPVTGIKVGFRIRDYMGDSKSCAVPMTLGPGDSANIELFGLFGQDILNLTEAAKSIATIDLSYVLDGKEEHKTYTQTLRVLDRNATTWVDDRRAAAFVTAKDPAILTFAKNVSSVVKEASAGGIDQNLCAAIALHETLRLFGLTYSSDPIPVKSAGGDLIDYIQFPRQTLEYRGGKCSDFSVLYCALLEALGIETAYITIPGHIFMAVLLTRSPDEARRIYPHAEDLIFLNGKTWLPIEITDRDVFLQSWAEGAKEWRNAFAKQEAAFYPLHDSWKVYEPVALPGTGKDIAMPAADRIVAGFKDQASKFAQQAVFIRASSLEEQIKTAQDKRKPLNSLGVLYGSYGLYDKAQAQFRAALAKGDYLPSILNLATLDLLLGRRDEAVQGFTRALSLDPKSAIATLGLARAYHDAENYELASRYFAGLKALDSGLASRYGYLDLKGGDATRASNAADLMEAMPWQD